jgi:hypothetical protein
MYLDLNLQLTEEQSAFKESVHRFARECCGPAPRSSTGAWTPDVIARDSPLWDVLRQAYRLDYPR